MGYCQVIRPYLVCCVDVHEVIRRYVQFHEGSQVRDKISGNDNPFLLDIQAMRLDWCRVKPLPNTQWLAEDEMGLARLFPFVYGQFFLNMDLGNSFTSPKTLKALEQLVHSFHVMVCGIMSPRKTSSHVIDAHVKVFLSCCNRFEASYRGAEKAPFWSTKGNFVSLLNLEEQVKNSGSVRYLWDATRERFIQTVKPRLGAMRKTTSYFETKLMRIHKDMVIAWLKTKRRRKNKKGDGRRQYNNNYY